MQGDGYESLLKLAASSHTMAAPKPPGLCLHCCPPELSCLQPQASKIAPLPRSQAARRNGAWLLLFLPIAAWGGGPAPVLWLSCFCPWLAHVLNHRPGACGEACMAWFWLDLSVVDITFQSKSSQLDSCNGICDCAQSNWNYVPNFRCAPSLKPLIAMCVCVRAILHVCVHTCALGSICREAAKPSRPCASCWPACNRASVVSHNLWHYSFFTIAISQYATVIQNCTATLSISLYFYFICVK